MAHRRERHGRGMRGPLSLPNAYTGAPAPLRQTSDRAVFFTECIADGVRRIQRDCPRALVGVDVGVEDVPEVEGPWSRERVPLAAAIGGTRESHGQIVLFRRPLERRARTRRGLRILVFRTLVEQLSALTGISVEELDPASYAADEDWD